MQQELRFATFNVCNLALPGMKYYEDQIPYSVEEYDAKISWIAQQLDRLDADVIGLQDIFSQSALKDVLAKTQKYRDAHHIGFDPDPQADHLTPSVALISRLPVVDGAIRRAVPELVRKVRTPETAAILDVSLCNNLRTGDGRFAGPLVTAVLAG